MSFGRGFLSVRVFGASIFGSNLVAFVGVCGVELSEVVGLFGRYGSGRLYEYYIISYK